MNSIASFQAAGKWFNSDQAFNSLYPESVQIQAQKHWTPLRITRAAIHFLTPHKCLRILDIGSGIGKFCLAAGYYKRSAIFTGIEQRDHLVQLATAARDQLGLSNVHFHHGNFTRLNFNDYDHFYFFNAFYENLSGANKIDDSIEYTTELYKYYSHCLYNKLEDRPPGTRIVTFHSLEDEIPLSYRAVDSLFNNRLKCWIKD